MIGFELTRINPDQPGAPFSRTARWGIQAERADLKIGVPACRSQPPPEQVKTRPFRRRVAQPSSAASSAASRRQFRGTRTGTVHELAGGDACATRTGPSRPSARSDKNCPSSLGQMLNQQRIAALCQRTTGGHDSINAAIKQVKNNATCALNFHCHFFEAERARRGAQPPRLPFGAPPRRTRAASSYPTP